MDPRHDLYEEYTKDQLEEHLRKWPHHADREIVIRYLLEFQKKEKTARDDRKADIRHKQGRRIQIAAIATAAVVAFVIAWWNHHSNSQQPNANVPLTKTPTPYSPPSAPKQEPTKLPFQVPSSSPTP